jgi:hypothetical protein
MRNRLLLVFWVVPFLGGCVLHQVKESAIDYNQVVEEANNQLLVINVLRARDRAPLYLAEFSDIHGSFAESAGLGSGVSIPFGPGYVPTGTTSSYAWRYTATPTFSFQNSPTFDASALDTQLTTQGLLKPIDPLVWEYYWHRNYPTALLLYLFLQSIQDTGVDGGRIAIANDPDDATQFELFRKDFVDVVTCKGDVACKHSVHLHIFVTSEPYVGKNAGHFTLSEKDVLDNLKSFVGQPGLVVKEEADKPGSYELFSTSKPIVAICFQNPEMRPAPLSRAPSGATEESAAPAPRYQHNIVPYSLHGTLGRSELPPKGTPPSSPPTSPKPPRAQGAGATATLANPCTADVVDHEQWKSEAGWSQQYQLRSAEGMLEYLGALVRRRESLQDTDPDFTVGGEPHYLFRLYSEPAQSTGRDRVAVTYRGRSYYVREGDPYDHTLEVLALVTQLINLNKNASEIPSTKTVNVAP